jgi:glutamate N-acetyltransferase / amino-acid N-acetyltransferase
VAADRVVAAAAVQTRNRVKAAPSRSPAATSPTATPGRCCSTPAARTCASARRARSSPRSPRVAAAELGCEPEDVLLCSTGVIGVPIPREPFLAGIPEVVAALSRDGAGHAAKAIMTTDLVPKEARSGSTTAPGTCVVGGMAKGSGMIAPAMATMLCVVTTDAPISGPVLRADVKDVVNRTFGRISVDGCMSTNDAVIVLATGHRRAGAEPVGVQGGAHLGVRPPRRGDRPGRRGREQALRIRVTGARSEDDAVAVGRAIGRQRPREDRVAGEDPNWGRIMAAMGAGPVDFDPRASPSPSEV